MNARDPSCEPLVTFDWTDVDSPSTAVVLAVADCRDADMTDLDPLAGVIDPEALDALLARHEVDATVDFTYEGYHIVVDGDGAGSLFDSSPSPVVGGDATDGGVAEGAE